MKAVTILAGVLTLGAPLAAHAANADHPYQNIDPRNDAGNNTGDYRVDRLNRAQLRSNGVPASSYPAPGGYGRPQAYYPPAYYPRAYRRPVPGYGWVPQPYYGGY